MGPILNLSIALSNLVVYSHYTGTEPAMVFTLVQDRDRHHNPLFTIVPILFSVPPPVRIPCSVNKSLQPMVNVSGTFRETRKKVGQRADVFIQKCSFNGFECTYRYVSVLSVLLLHVHASKYTIIKVLLYRWLVGTNHLFA